MTKNNCFQKIAISLAIILVLSFTFVFSTAFTGELSVYLGGMPVGVVQKCDGVVVSNYIEVDNGQKRFSPAKEGGILRGDLIKTIDGIDVFSAEDVEKLVKDAPITISVMRGENIVPITVLPTLDIETGKYKLGFTLKNELSGVGTMTYITKDKKFGAIGHKIYDKHISTPGAFPTGELYSCNVKGFDKNEKDKIGSIKGVFNRKTDKIGTVEKNINFGMFGKINTDYSNMTLIEVAKKEEITLGSASIFTTIEGNTPKEYEIEILKIEHQSKPAEKSLVIKVTDEELLRTTGGILQGMSGSPIVQNGKLIGALTHVFVSNTVYGYGIFIEWMLEN